MKIYKKTLALSALLFVAACGIERPVDIYGSTGYIKDDSTRFQRENGTHYKIGNPYTIDGKVYTPKEDYNYEEDGIASWYGPNFNRKPTSNGGVFDMNLITAAHRTLPIPSVVKVTNLENGLSIIVKITDRGPFAKDRIIDLSRASAEKLKILGSGTALVRVRIIEDQSRALKLAMTEGNEKDSPSLATNVVKVSLKKLHKQSATLGEQSGAYIQAGAYKNFDNAVRVAKELKYLGTTKIYKMKRDGGTLYAVRIGPFKDSKSMKASLETVISKGYDAIVKVL